MKHSISIPFFRFMLLILFINVVIDLSAQQITIGPDVTFHFQPEGKVFGDPIPFFHDGVHHLF